MLTAEAQVETDRASRYLLQLCRHASKMGRSRGHRIPAHLAGNSPASHRMPAHVDAEWSDTHGTVRVDDATCTMAATSDTLTLRVDAADEATLRRMQDAITRDLTSFSRRDPLTVHWYRPDLPTGQIGDSTPAPTGTTTAPGRRRRTVVLATIGVLAVAAHVVAAMLSAPQWTSWAASTVLVVVLVKIAVIVGHVTLGRRIFRRRNDSPARLR